MFPICILHELRRRAQGTGTVIPHALDGAWAHLFKADDQSAVNQPTLNESTSGMQPSTASRTRVIQVQHGASGKPQIVDNPLTTGKIGNKCQQRSGTLKNTSFISIIPGCIAITVAGDDLLHFIVVDLRIDQGFDRSFIPQLGVLPRPARLEELG